MDQIQGKRITGLDHSEFAALLARHQLTFYWGAVNKRWWISLTSENNNHRNIITVPAEDFLAARAAASDYINRKFK